MLKPLPSITIVVPTYQRVQYLKESLDSVLSQDYPFFDVIVSDDSDTEAVRSLVNGYGSDKIRYLQNKPPRGLMGKLNDSLSLVRGEWMLVLCDDDVLEPGYLSAIGSLAASRPEASLVRSRFKIIDEAGKLVREDAPCAQELSPFEFASKIFDIRKKLFSMNITGIAFRPGRLLELGGFKPYHRGFHADCMAWFMLGVTGPSLCDPRTLCKIRQHQGSLTMAADPVFEAMFETALQMQQEVQAIIGRLEERAKTAEERGLVRTCRSRFKRYFSRLLGPYDAAFENALLKERFPWKSFVKILHTMRQLHIPLYRRIAVYASLAAMPPALRIKALSTFKRHRRGRTDEYYKKYGLGV